MIKKKLFKIIFTVAIILAVIAYVLPIAAGLFFFGSTYITGWMNEWKIYQGGIREMKIVDFPSNTVDAEAGPAILLEENEHFASLYLRNGLGVYINKENGEVRLDNLGATSLNDYPAIDVLDCYKDQAYCIIAQWQYRNFIGKTQIVQYKYREGSSAILYEANSETKLKILHIPGLVGVFENNGNAPGQQTLINTKTLTILHNPTNAERTAAGFESNTFNKPYPIELSEQVENQRNHPAPTYLETQPIIAEKRVNTAGNYFGTPYDIDYLIKKDGITIFQFKTNDETMMPLGYFGGRYYFVGRRNTPTKFVRYLGIIDLQSKLSL